MVVVEKSLCRCGKCNSSFEVEWELEYIDSRERDMGEECVYSGQIDVTCLQCGNVISAQLHVVEFPIGQIEVREMFGLHDSEGTGNSSVEKPLINCFDL